LKLRGTLSKLKLPSQCEQQWQIIPQQISQEWWQKDWRTLSKE
jgi:hypothetical protein